MIYNYIYHTGEKYSALAWTSKKHLRVNFAGIWLSCDISIAQMERKVRNINCECDMYCCTEIAMWHLSKWNKHQNCASHCTNWNHSIRFKLDPTAILLPYERNMLLLSISSDISLSVNMLALMCAIKKLKAENSAAEPYFNRKHSREDVSDAIAYIKY